MAKTKISEFSTTPGNNTDIDGINIAEGCAPSGINDAIRELMAQLKDFQTGAAGDSFNGPVGTTTAAAGAFTTLSASSSVTLSGGTANGVPYLNGSKVLTTGSALTFDGTNLGVGVNSRSVSGYSSFGVNGSSGSLIDLYTNGTRVATFGADTTVAFGSVTNIPVLFTVNGSEQMRLTSTGLGIGTSSPSNKLEVASSTTNTGITIYNNNGTGGLNARLGFKSLNGYDASSVLAAVTAVPNSSGNTATSLVFSTSGDNSLASAGLTERMRLDSVGNLGLGVVPSAWASGYTAFDIKRGSVFQNSSSNWVGLANNAFHNGTNWIYKESTIPRVFRIQNDQFEWLTAPSGTAGNAISFTQAMTLDASGNLGIGTSSPSSKLDVSGGAATTTIRVRQTAAGSASEVRFGDDAGTDGGLIIKGGSSYGSYGGANSFMFWNNRSGPVVFGTNDTERARIDSSGNLLVGTTGTVYSGKIGVSFDGNGGSGAQGIALIDTNSSLNGDYALFVNSSGNVAGKITRNGTTTVAYTTSSDYRLKENIQPMTGALAKVQALKPCTYKWKADGSDGEGFIAHELAEVVPQCVTGEKDAVDADGKPVYQGIDTSFLAGLYAAALQELTAEVNSLKAEIAALKA